MTLADCAGYEDLIDPTKDYGAHGPMIQAICDTCEKPIVQTYKPMRGFVKISQYATDIPKDELDRINSETPLMWVHVSTHTILCEPRVLKLREGSERVF